MTANDSGMFHHGAERQHEEWGDIMHRSTMKMKVCASEALLLSPALLRPGWLSCDLLRSQLPASWLWQQKSMQQQQQQQQLAICSDKFLLRLGAFLGLLYLHAFWTGIICRGEPGRKLMAGGWWRYAMWGLARCLTLRDKGSCLPYPSHSPLGSRSHKLYDYTHVHLQGCCQPFGSLEGKSEWQ